MRVLIIDDSEKIREELRNILQKVGYVVVGEAANGLEGLKLVADLHPDLVTLDIIMPEMDGIECYRKMRTLDYQPRCLIVSVLAVEPRVVKAYEREIYPNHFLRKPISEKELRDKIQDVMALPPLPFPPVVSDSATDSP